jgi:hypothetical protein
VGSAVVDRNKRRKKAVLKLSRFNGTFAFF